MHCCELCYLVTSWLFLANVALEKCLMSLLAHCAGSGQWSGCCGDGGPMIRAVRDPGKQCSPLHNRTGARSAARSDHRMSRWQEICDKLVNSVCEPTQPDLNSHSHQCRWRSFFNQLACHDSLLVGDERKGSFVFVLWLLDSQDLSRTRNISH